MKHIAIVGTEGSGKTVFVTVLAKFFGPGEREIFFNPLGKTIRFVENNWNRLQAGQWPDQTTSGEMFNYEWECQCGQGESFRLKLVDCAGQDLRRIFADEIPEQLRPLADYVHSAQVVIFLLNLGDFVGVRDLSQVTENIYVLKHAIDTLKASGKETALILTQIDLYDSYLEKHGTWLEVVRNTNPLNLLWGAHLLDGSVPLLPVSAVFDTSVADQPDGGTRRIPAASFRCQGIEEIGAWLIKAAKRAAPPIPPPQPPPPRNSTRREWLPWAIGGVVVFLLWVGWPSSRPCIACGSTGRVPCSTCGGSGKTGIFFKDPCSACGATRQRKCPTCQGVGKIKN